MMSQFGFLAEVIAALDAAGVTYMVTGSIASTHHAEPRMTRDIDIVIETDHVAVKLLVNQFDPTRFYVGNAQQAVAARDMFNVIDTTGGWKVDLIIRKARRFSEVELGRRQHARIGEVDLCGATAEDTILSKLEWMRMGGSDRQLADVVAVLETQGPALDHDYMDRWAPDLGVENLLQQARRLAE